jgi:hypothetical protein
MRRLVLILVAVAFALDARATPNFPSALRIAESLASDPPCGLCHRGTPGVGTVTTPFGISMRQRGLVMYDEATLRAALAAMRAEGVDSDGDGTPDLDELAVGTDPNVAAPTSSSEGGGAPTNKWIGEPVYGCSAGAKSAGLDVWTALAVLGVLLPRKRRGRSALPPAYFPSDDITGRKNS